MSKLLIVLFLGFTLSQSGFAATEGVRWTGIVQEERGYHTPDHNNDHQLEFVRQNDNESFDVVDSDDLLSLHAEKDKKLLVEVEGEVSPRFLFWGGNLKVTSFKVLGELEEIQHREPKRRPNMSREYRGGIRSERF